MASSRSLLLCFLLLPCAAAAGEEAAPPPAPFQVRSWLLAGPDDVPRPAFAGAKEHGFGPDELVKADLLHLDDLAPAPGATFIGPGGTPLEWRARDQAIFASGTGLRVGFAATRLRTDRFVKAELTLLCFHRLRAFLDGKQVALKTEVGKPGDAEPGQATATVELEPGTHLLLVQTVFAPEGPEHWDLFARLAVDGQAPPGVTADARPERRLAIADLLDTEALDAFTIADSGLHVALTWRQPEVPADFQDRWTEIRDAETGAVLRSTRGRGPLDSLAWRPLHTELSFVTRKDGKATVWRQQAAGGDAVAVLEDVAEFGGYRWMPDGDSLLYFVTEKDKADERGVKRMRGLADRWPGFRDQSHLHQAWPDGARRRLTAGELGVSLEDVRHDGGALLFTRTRYGLTERPFSRTELYELDLETLNARPLFETSTFDTARYAPDGSAILIRAGLSFAVERGLAAAPPAPPNDYDGQLYRWRDQDDVRWLTESFAPSVLDARFTSDGRICVLAEDGDRRRLFVAGEDFATVAPLPAPVDAVAGMSVAALYPRIVYHGSSAALPPRVVVQDLAPESPPRVLAIPGDETWERVRFGAVEEFTFTSAAGDEVAGRVHLPPDFDPERRYPAIVYYYGGTSPIERAFGGRYPLDLWAAQGYVVYTLNPSGATGYGLAWSARHVNDWGRRTSAEVLEGTERFLAAHPYVDPERLGCIGASYGGFLTLHLLTVSDRFRAAVSHAGISSISSYWGEGYWGYLYSAVATADAYPWNRPDVYVEQSPLFHADRVTTPLLLLHGEEDTNVPIGESEQMYTALRILGREVEFIRFAGENHHVLTYPRRVLWMKTILAWFDRHLKDDPAWWDALHPN